MGGIYGIQGAEKVVAHLGQRLFRHICFHDSPHVHQGPRSPRHVWLQVKITLPLVPFEPICFTSMVDKMTDMMKGFRRGNARECVDLKEE